MIIISPCKQKTGQDKPTPGQDLYQGIPAAPGDDTCYDTSPPVSKAHTMLKRSYDQIPNEPAQQAQHHPQHKSIKQPISDCFEHIITMPCTMPQCSTIHHQRDDICDMHMHFFPLRLRLFLYICFTLKKCILLKPVIILISGQDFIIYLLDTHHSKYSVKSWPDMYISVSDFIQCPSKFLWIITCLSYLYI